MGEYEKTIEYEKTLEDIEKNYGMVPEFMKFFPRDVIVKEWPDWKKEPLDEIYLERARYFLSTDQMLEELLVQENMSGTRKVEFRAPGASEEAEVSG
ncbi:MAG: hypothetical protein J5U17_08940 [Candidatus Methanoperedens sp.]|nr:hypothetical protein [Candidatus Methanoperedens sp.]MCE8427967.1 hypothetical protein [Candidatus Methanoperedens sp.]